MTDSLLLQEIFTQNSLNNQRVIRDHANVLDNYSDEQFRERFRFGKIGFLKLVEYLKSDLEPRSNRRCNYSPEAQLLVALRFYANGSAQLMVGDTFAENASQSAVSKIISKASLVLASKADSVITFPSTTEEISAVKSGFYKLYGMPGVLGCVDGTHIPIVPTAKFKPPEEFYGRKGCTINAQFVCNHELRFTNAVIAHPGSAHDMRIWKESLIGKEFISGTKNGQGHLLGDSGYALRKVCYL